MNKSFIAFTALALVSRQLDHCVTLLAMEETHNWVQHAVSWQSRNFPPTSHVRSTRNPHAQRAVAALLALQLDYHDISSVKVSTPDLAAMSIRRFSVILKEPNLFGMQV